MRNNIPHNIYKNNKNESNTLLKIYCFYFFREFRLTDVTMSLIYTIRDKPSVSTKVLYYRVFENFPFPVFVYLSLI